MPNSDDFKMLSDRYLKSAEALLTSENFDSAYYLAGYSVECLLKSIICKRIQQYEFPPKNVERTHYTHILERLIETAGLNKNLEFDRGKSTELEKSYKVLTDWDPQILRYDASSVGKEKAKNYLDEIKNQKGFFIWLNKYL